MNSNNDANSNSLFSTALTIAAVAGVGYGGYKGIKHIQSTNRAKNPVLQQHLKNKQTSIKMSNEPKTPMIKITGLDNMKERVDEIIKKERMK